MLLMNRVIRTKVPAVIRAPTSKVHKEARHQKKKKKEQQKDNTDNRRRAREVKYKVGDKVLLKQTKTTVKRPFDLEAYESTGTDGQQDSDEEDDWEYGLSVTDPGQQDDEQVQEEQTEVAEEQAQGVVQRQVTQERWHSDMEV